ncbi:MAG: bifunctional 5,10-methylenetetrahydrofolate dehydrogenase/5,10-methenyltetrahydrofolate cyclohydrolase [Caulobacteraceae bacterium]
MTAQIIDAGAIASALVEKVAAGAAELTARTGTRPGLAVILAGEDPASAIYVRSKAEQSRAAGFHSEVDRLPADVPQRELEALVERLNADPAIHGVLVQLPLPAGLSTAAVLARLDPAKDVDGLTLESAGRLASGLGGLVPCTPQGCMVLLSETLGDLAGKEAVVVGRSILVGRPIAQLLLAADCTVTMAHSRTTDLPAVCRRADILIVAAGRPGMVRGSWIKPGAAVIDVGINRVPFRDPVKAAAGKTKVVGDVAFKEATEVAGWITKVPGGVGLMTVACLLSNTLLAARRSLGLE